MADEQQLEGIRDSHGEVSAVKINRDILKQIKVTDEDLAMVAEPSGISVRAQLDQGGIRVVVTGHALFGDANDLGRDDGLKARSRAAHTIDVDESDAKEVAELLGRIAAKYRRRAIQGAMTSAFMSMTPIVSDEGDMDTGSD